MPRFWTAAALTLTLAVFTLAPSAHAWPISGAPCASIDWPPCWYKKCGKPLPTFQAAPWYLYWPYDAHFQTPAPVFAAYSPPPVYPLPYNPYAPGFAYPGAYWSTSGHAPIPGCGGTGWPAIPTPHR